MKKIATFITLAFTPCLSFAFFCPTNFNQIDFGSTIDQVSQQCGKPDIEEKKEVEPNVPQEWSYFIPQTVAMNATASQTSQGTLKASFTFDKDGKAINIAVNGIGVGESTICGQSIQLGATMDTVKSACGQPAFINKQQAQSADQGSSPQKTQVDIYTYNSNPPVKLTFENGVLTKKE